MSPGLWIRATRPAFLSVTLVGVLLGLATAGHEQTFRSVPLAAITLLFALFAQAGANVINDYYDARSGCDAANVDRIAPFTGGSRFIQDGLLSEAQTRLFGYTLLLLVIPAGVWLVAQSGSTLLWIGLIGLFCAWAYSAPPLKLQGRGLGELAIALAWLMVVIGSDYVQSQTLTAAAIFAGLAYAPLVANVLFVNQIPDRKADASVGKNTLIVRHGHAIAPMGSIVLCAFGCTALLTGVALRALPAMSLLALLAMLPATTALNALLAGPADPARLKTAIPLTILSCLLFGALLTTALLI